VAAVGHDDHARLWALRVGHRDERIGRTEDRELLLASSANKYGEPSVSSRRTRVPAADCATPRAIRPPKLCATMSTCVAPVSRQTFSIVSVRPATKRWYANWGR
jgi:hypothetical protein